MTLLTTSVAAIEQLLRLRNQLLEIPEFAQVAEALATGQPATIDGVWGSSCALVASSLQTRLPAPLLVVLPTQREADEFAADLLTFGVGDPLTFPDRETVLQQQVVIDEAVGQRLRVLKTLAAATKQQHPSIVVASIQAMLQGVPSASAIQGATQTIHSQQRLEIQPFLTWLVEQGFEATSAVELPGEFSHRGGILDLFAADWEAPVRIELFDEEVESIRQFDIATQRSLARLEQVQVTAWNEGQATNAHLANFLPEGSCILLVEPDRIAEEGKSFLNRSENALSLHSLTTVFSSFTPYAVASCGQILSGASGKRCQLPVESVDRFSGDISHIRDELDHMAVGQQVLVVSTTDAEVERLREIFATSALMATGRLHFPLGSLREGFRLRGSSSMPGTAKVRRKKTVAPSAEEVAPEAAASTAGTIVLTASELFHRGELRRSPRRHLGKAIDSFIDLRDGDLVVHLAHGIGRYRGLKLIEKQGQAEEHLEVEFDGGTKLYVPAVKIDLVQKYVGGTKTKPSLAKIGGKTWVKQKQAAEHAVQDLAAEMLDLQAMRASRPGIAFNADSEWQREFDTSFPYTETPDQLAAISAIKQDMLRARPMDRLLCGDVGFGKTEVAMRAAFKAVDSGYQVAVLVPTTILAEQHFNSFTRRLAEFPFEIAKLSRFCSPQEEREALAGLKSGRVDIVIGTHRVASRDVEFHNLGLVIIDEEQRFGVDVKERLKTLRATVDILTLSATPIPRTLHMSLVGVRDISNLETAPADRVAVETKVARFDPDLIRGAVLRELNRGGQIYFVHNRVNDIELIAQRLQMIVPEATIRIGHGQMAEGELEQVMLGFIEHKFDMLLATTIVESGLDIPNANTIFIDEADKYGLADLHQLRGRVGRYKNRAHCYLLIDPHKHITPNAARRLRAIEEFSEMGAGFAISMRDLEIRGAGNLLGTQQSGHIAAIGYELYCQLLETAVLALQRKPPRLKLDVDVNLPGDAFLPDDYVQDMRLKIDLYRRLTRVASFDQLQDFEAELTDRFGEIPKPVRRLLALTELKMEAAIWQISAVFIENNFVVFRYADRQRIEHLARLHPRKVRIVDDRSAYVPITQELADPDEMLKFVKSILQPGK
ncbi:MAG: transcription-repair coupling factor [Planctomycetaceae bacterium]